MRADKRGCFVLENSRGETVRTFAWAESDVFVIYRHDNRRVETISSPAELDEQGVEFEVLAVTTTHSIKAAPLQVGRGARLLWSDKVTAFPPEHALVAERKMESKAAIGWSFALQAALAILFVIAGALTGSGTREAKEVTVTVLPAAAVEKLLAE